MKGVENMQFKQKLLYFAVGSAFVVLSQIIISSLAPTGIAQSDSDVVTCKSLRIVDDSGRVRVQLESLPIPNVPVNDVIQVFNEQGETVYRVRVTPEGGWVILGNPEAMKMQAEIRADENGGRIAVYGTNPGIRAALGVNPNGGIVSAYSGKAGVTMSSFPEGGHVTVHGNDESRELMIEKPVPPR